MVTMTAATKRRKEKELVEKRANQERLVGIIDTLENIRSNYPQIHRNTKNKINALLGILKDKNEVNLSIRAANAISILDELTRNKRTESYIRTMLWQVVSNLEGVRERWWLRYLLGIPSLLPNFRYDEDGEKVIHLTSKMHLDRSLMKKFQKVVNKNNSTASGVKNSERKRNDL